MIAVCIEIDTLSTRKLQDLTVGSDHSSNDVYSVDPVTDRLTGAYREVG